MEKLIVFSDSHSDLTNMEKIILLHSQIHTVIHLGDYVKDILQMVHQHKGRRYEFVKGNNDYYARADEELILEVEDVKILLTHGHLEAVKGDLRTLIQKSKGLAVDLTLFGHTHLAQEVKSSGVHLINPGSISSRHCVERPSYVILTVDKKNISSSFETL